jgi:hypothetical protein
MAHEAGAASWTSAPSGLALRERLRVDPVGEPREGVQEPLCAEEVDCRRNGESAVFGVRDHAVECLEGRRLRVIDQLLDARQYRGPHPLTRQLIWAILFNGVPECLELALAGPVLESSSFWIQKVQHSLCQLTFPNFLSPTIREFEKVDQQSIEKRHEFVVVVSFPPSRKVLIRSVQFWRKNSSPVVGLPLMKQIDGFG